MTSTRKQAFQKSFTFVEKYDQTNQMDFSHARVEHVFDWQITTSLILEKSKWPFKSIKAKSLQLTFGDLCLVVKPWKACTVKIDRAT